MGIRDWAKSPIPISILSNYNYNILNKLIYIYNFIRKLVYIYVF